MVGGGGGACCARGECGIFYSQRAGGRGGSVIAKDTLVNMSWVRRLGLGGRARQWGLWRRGGHARRVACVAPLAEA
jgi:hypothetical protein